MGEKVNDGRPVVREFVPESLAGERVDRVVSFITGASRSMVSKCIHDGEVRPVLARPFVWQWNSRLDVSAMQKASSLLIGEHDFSSFENPSSPRASKVRKIEN